MSPHDGSFQKLRNCVYNYIVKVMHKNSGLFFPDTV